MGGSDSFKLFGLSFFDHLLFHSNVKKVLNRYLKEVSKEEEIGKQHHTLTLISVDGLVRFLIFRRKES